MSPTHDDPTSVHLLGAQGGRAESLEWLVSRFQPLLETQVRLRLGARAATREDVRDIVSEAWLVTLPRLGSLEARGGRLAPVFMRFLASAVQNLCNNLLRKRIRRRLVRESGGGDDESRRGPALDQVADETLGIVTRAAEKEVAVVMSRALARLSEEKQEVLVQRLVEQRTNQEIAEQLGVPANTVAVRYRRALQELREHLPAGAFEGVTGLDADR